MNQAESEREPDPPMTVRVCEGIALVTLNRPEIRNAISDLEVIDALCLTISGLDRDPSVRAVVLTGTGSCFSSGGNLKGMVKGGSIHDDIPAKTRTNYRRGIQRLPVLFEALEVPVIAAVNGPAIGAGCDLACMCDLRICSADATFAASFVALGLVPGDGGAFLLPRIVGFARATQMALTGDAIDAATALSWGLVSAISAEKELVGDALSLAGRVARHPQTSVRLTKRLLRQVHGGELDRVLELSAAFQALAHATDDHVLALNSRLERRQ